jgi:hypothetical protein
MSRIEKFRETVRAAAITTATAAGPVRSNCTAYYSTSPASAEWPPATPL